MYIIYINLFVHHVLYRDKYYIRILCYRQIYNIGINNLFLKFSRNLEMTR